MPTEIHSAKMVKIWVPRRSLAPEGADHRIGIKSSKFPTDGVSHAKSVARLFGLD